MVRFFKNPPKYCKYFTLSERLVRCKSVEEGRDWIVWSDQVEEICLVKADAGLGFSILDYQVHFIRS